MLDIGWTEILVIAVVAIVVIGPKDLPRALRTVGQWVGKARAMSRDLQNSVNDMISESELDELRKAGNSIGDFGSNDMLNADFGNVKSSFDDEPDLNNNPTPPPPTPLKWPPDEAEDEVAAAADIMPDITQDDDHDDEDEVEIPPSERTDDVAAAKSTDR